jgi:hypothetical protein
MDSGDYVIAPAPAPKQQPAPATPAGSSLVAPGRSYADAVAGGAAAAAATKGVAAAPAKPAAAPSGCVIKGNINSKGEKIYHTPESGAYERVSHRVHDITRACPRGPAAGSVKTCPT